MIEICAQEGCLNVPRNKSSFCSEHSMVMTLGDPLKIPEPVLGTAAPTIETTLAERGARYGKFADHAVIAQGLQDVMRAAPGWSRLAPDQKQALSVIADKVARMLNGDPDYLDNWHDIIGYAKLVEDRLKAKQ